MNTEDLKDVVLEGPKKLHPAWTVGVCFCDPNNEDPHEISIYIIIRAPGK